MYSAISHSPQQRQKIITYTNYRYRAIHCPTACCQLGLAQAVAWLDRL